MTDDKTLSIVTSIQAATFKDAFEATMASRWNVRQAIAFSPDSRVLAASLPDGKIKLWDNQTGKLITTLPGHPATQPENSLIAALLEPPTISLLKFQNEKTLISVGRDGKINFWGMP